VYYLFCSLSIVHSTKRALHHIRYSAGFVTVALTKKLGLFSWFEGHPRPWNIIDDLVKTQKNVTPAPIFIGINSSRSPDDVPAKAGNHLKTLDSHFHACALKRYGAQARE
jgi:hypothetical protein